MEAMVDALLREIELTGSFLAATPADPRADLAATPAGRRPEVGTLYLGGGTPSLLPDPALGRLIDAVRDRYSLQPYAEITLEANPDDISVERLGAWKALGINRLSIGVQSFRDEDLRWMNRAHTASEAREAIKMARAAGFHHDSVDLIYGTPGLSDENLLENLAQAIDLGCPHLSCYALTVEPRTALARDIRLGKMTAVDPDAQARQFLLLSETLRAAGYEHYEISNFALPGHRSRHNSSYWQGVPYLGLGPSAHSFNGTDRRWNVANNALYLQAIARGEVPFEQETLTPVQRLNEYTMTALRTMEGMDLDRVDLGWGAAARGQLERAAEAALANRWMTREGQRLILTAEGRLFADGIASDLFLGEGAL